MPGVSFTIDILSPANALNSVDFPTLGLPTTATIGFFLFFISNLPPFRFRLQLFPNIAFTKSRPLDFTISTRTCKAFSSSSTVISSRKMFSPLRSTFSGSRIHSPRSFPLSCFFISCPVKSPDTVMRYPKNSLVIPNTLIWRKSKASIICSAMERI